LAVWGVSPDWLKPKGYASIIRRLGEAAAPAEWVGVGGAVRAPSLHLYPGICLTTEENHVKPQSGYPKGARLNMAERIRLVDLAIAGDSLDWPAGPCRPWLSPQATGSTLGQLDYLPSRRTRGFPTSANFESKLAVRDLMWLANSGTHRSSCIYLLFTYQGAPVARRRHLDCNTCNFGLGAGCGSPRGARIIHHGADELLT
jgi:hypothetical protein